MSKTYIRAISNDSDEVIQFQNTEAGRDNRTLGPLSFELFEDPNPVVPWGPESGEYLSISVGGTTWYIWQHADDIWVTSDPTRSMSNKIVGDSGTGEVKALVVRKDGSLRMTDWEKAHVVQRTRFRDVGQLSEGEVAQYETCSDGTALERSTIQFEETPDHSFWQTIVIDPTLSPDGADSPNHQIVGFGGAFSDAAVLNIDSMPTQAQEEILGAYYGSDGIGYSTGRVPMGSTDFSTASYNYCDTEDDFSLDSFALADIDTKLKIPMIQRANALRGSELKLFSSIWTAPPWMKDSKTYVGGRLIGIQDSEEIAQTEEGKQRARYKQAYAKYFSKFFTEYAKHGVHFWATTVQNEPTGSRETKDWELIKVWWESMYYSAEEQARFIRDYLGPELAKEHPDVKIICYEDQKSSGTNHSTMPQDPLEILTILKEEGKAHYVKGIALHWYQKSWAFMWYKPGDPWCTQSLIDTRNELVAQGFDDVFLFASEACQGYETTSRGTTTDWVIQWKRAEEYGKDIITDLNHWVVGWTDWNLALDMDGGPNWAKNRCDALILCDKDNESFYLQPMFYYFAHFTKFITPGSTNVIADSRASQGTPMDCTAFKTPDNKLVIVVQNADIYPHNYWIQVKGHGYLNKSIAKGSIQTFVLDL